MLTMIAVASIGCANAETLSAERLGVLYNLDDASSQEVAFYYAAHRAIPKSNVVGVHLGGENILAPGVFAPLRLRALDQLPASVQSLALVWSRPFAVGCMSITSAFAAGYRSAFCEPGCGLTAPNPLFDSEGWLPADTVGWWPAMLIPSDDAAAARALIELGIAAEGSNPRGTVYLVRTRDAARNVRSETYSETESELKNHLPVVEMDDPSERDVAGAIGYFTGAARVDEISHIHFLPGAIADHLTSTGGVLTGGKQMSAAAWLKQGATASYGNVSEPCNHLEKFPNISVLLHHYLRGETVIEAYWKSVAMPGQGLFIGEPLARPYATHRQ
ncbi:MAG TPA: TIGR03790 family protein [Steroidobacteraceae bacterium]|jgi:uncharacterized protein (TIGR03790 family)|nr:TIGR03790 family protein [Steroidobacteraceae bacterium]